MSIFKKLLIIIIIFALASFCVACKDPIEKYEPYISELRDNIFVAEGDAVSVVVITGKREEPFLMDGFCSETKDFTLVTITPKNIPSDAELEYKIVFDGTEFEGSFLKHPFGVTYSADLAMQAKGNSVLVEVFFGSGSEKLEAVSIKTADMITASKAIEIAEKKLKKQIDSLKNQQGLQAEIYVRLMSNPVDNLGGYFWYVAFIGESQIIYAALINPVSMEIVAIRD